MILDPCYDNYHLGRPVPPWESLTSNPPSPIRWGIFLLHCAMLKPTTFLRAAGGGSCRHFPLCSSNVSEPCVHFPWQHDYIPLFKIQSITKVYNRSWDMDDIDSTLFLKDFGAGACLILASSWYPDCETLQKPLDFSPNESSIHLLHMMLEIEYPQTY